jgi:nitroimidazol reductase NimA-like FMN-containing flavoprotein (pyridoxamine 5'-phosphate oxidase superfamily)
MTSYYNKVSAVDQSPERAGAASHPEPSPRTTVRRRAGRGRYERATIEAILDEGLVGHVAVVSDGQPYAIPMLYARAGERIYLHGSPLSRLLGALAEEVPLCLTVTLLDGLVLARSAFHHSLNYRSVVVLGRGRVVSEPSEKLAGLRTIVEHVSPGRSAHARGPNEQELEATELIELALGEASAKVRTGPPVDAPEDYALPVWAGELPLRLVVGEPVTDPRCSEPVPDSVRRERGRRV